MVACTSKSPSGTIDAMQKRVDAVERQVEMLYNQDFTFLVGEYQALDTTIARTKDISKEMAFFYSRSFSLIFLLFSL